MIIIIHISYPVCHIPVSMNLVSEKAKGFSMALAANANNANTGMDDSQSETGADMAPLFDIHASVQD